MRGTIQLLALALMLSGPAATRGDDPAAKAKLQVTETADYVQIDSDALQARINKKGYMSGIRAAATRDYDDSLII